MSTVKQDSIYKTINMMSSFVFIEDKKRIMNIRISIKKNTVILILSDNLPKADYDAVIKIISKKQVHYKDFKYNYFLKTNNIILNY